MKNNPIVQSVKLHCVVQLRDLVQREARDAQIHTLIRRVAIEPEADLAEQPIARSGRRRRAEEAEDRGWPRPSGAGVGRLPADLVAGRPR